MKHTKLNSHGFGHLLVAGLVVAAIAVIGTYMLVSSHAATLSSVVDISSPQCGRKLGHYRYGIVGLNGERLDFQTNPCLNSQVKHFDNYSLYVGANYPSKNCKSSMSAYDCGRLAGQFDVWVAKQHHLKYKVWWIDVESGRGIPWSTQTNNANFLRGMFTALRTSTPGSLVGLYSTQTMWQDITGGLRLPAFATWHATGPAPGAKPAFSKVQTFCGKSFAGARVLYVQYVSTANLDTNIACP